MYYTRFNTYYDGYNTSSSVLLLKTALSRIRTVTVQLFIVLGCVMIVVYYGRPVIKKSLFLIGKAELAISGQHFPTGLDILKHLKARQKCSREWLENMKKTFCTIRIKVSHVRQDVIAYYSK